MVAGMLATVLLCAALPLTAAQAAGTSPYPSMEAPFTQQLFATSPSMSLLAGIAFAPNGDVLAANCDSDGQLHRFSATQRDWYANELADVPDTSRA